MQKLAHTLHPLRCRLNVLGALFAKRGNRHISSKRILHRVELSAATRRVQPTQIRVKRSSSTASRAEMASGWLHSRANWWQGELSHWPGQPPYVQLISIRGDLDLLLWPCQRHSNSKRTKNHKNQLSCPTHYNHQAPAAEPLATMQARVWALERVSVMQ